MNSREPKIGDVIVPLHVMRRQFAAMSPFTVQVTERNAKACRELVASGRLVIVDPQPQEEHGPNNKGSNQ